MIPVGMQNTSYSWIPLLNICPCCGVTLVSGRLPFLGHRSCSGLGLGTGLADALSQGPTVPLWQSPSAAEKRPAMMNDAAAVQDFVRVLEDYKKGCERQGKYIEADIAKKRLEELRQHEEGRRQEALRSRQVAQRLGIEEAHMLEFQQFNTMWDRKMKEYDERAAELLEAMRQRHELDAHEFQEKKLAEPPKKTKHSSELLDQRRIEGVLARSGDYAEAQKVKVRADAMEVAEHDRAKLEREQHMMTVHAKFTHRQEQELNALRQRVQSGAEEQRHARQVDLERLLQRYNNIKAELESQQTAERTRQRKGFGQPPVAEGPSSPRRGASGTSMSSISRPSSARSRLSNSR